MYGETTINAQDLNYYSANASRSEFYGDAAVDTNNPASDWYAAQSEALTAFANDSALGSLTGYHMHIADTAAISRVRAFRVSYTLWEGFKEADTHYYESRGSKTIYRNGAYYWSSTNYPIYFKLSENANLFTSGQDMINTHNTYGAGYWDFSILPVHLNTANILAGYSPGENIAATFNYKMEIPGTFIQNMVGLTLYLWCFLPIVYYPFDYTGNITGQTFIYQSAQIGYYTL